MRAIAVVMIGAGAVLLFWLYGPVQRQLVNGAAPNAPRAH